MGKTKNTLTTQREKVAIFALAYGLVKTWTETFVLAYDGTPEQARERGGFATIVQRWKNRPDIVATFQDMQNLIYDRDRSNRLQGKKEGERLRDEERGGESIRTKTEPPKGQGIDYTKPENQTAKLNELVNNADDIGETLDALKVIIQTQKADREAAKEGKVVRAYIPMTCNDCPLYKRRKK